MQDLVCTRIREGFRAEGAQVILACGGHAIGLWKSRRDGRKFKRENGKCSLCGCENNGACPVQA